MLVDDNYFISLLRQITTVAPAAIHVVTDVGDTKQITGLVVWKASHQPLDVDSSKRLFWFFVIDQQESFNDSSRSERVSPADVPDYHCVGGCVRRASFPTKNIFEKK